MGEPGHRAGGGRVRRWADTIGWSVDPVDVRVSAIVFAVAGLAYLPGIGWGLPAGIGPAWTDGWSPDGIAPLGFGEVYHALFSETPNFSYQYPLFHYYVQVVACAPVLLALWATGGIEGFSATWPYGLADPPAALAGLTVAGRIPSLVMGAGAVVAAWQIGRETFGRRAGMLGAAAVGLAAPLVFYARTSNVDVPAFFWTALGISVFAACVTRGVTLARAVAFGLFAALAIGTKDTAWAAFVAMAPALALLPGPGGAVGSDRVPRGWGRPPPGRWRTLGIGVGVAILAYLVTSGLAIAPGRWIDHVRFLVYGPLDGYWAGAPTPEELVATAIRAARVWAGAVGAPVAVLAAVGAAWAARWRPGALWLLPPALAAIAGVVLPWRFVFPRFFLVPALVAGLFAGFALDRLLAGRRAGFRRAGVVAAVLALGWGVAKGVDLTWAMFDETREEAAAWLEAEARPGDCVAHTFWISKMPAPPEGVLVLELPWREEPVATMAAERPRFLVEVAASPGEEEFEYLVTPALRRWLASSEGGYRLAFELPYPGRVAGRQIAWVSPPVRIWVREGPGSGGPSACEDPREVTLP